MASIPLNLTLIREDFQNPRALSQIKASMLAAPTDYIMVVGTNDIVDVTGVLAGGVHYLATHVTTRRAYRHSRPVLAYEPIHLLQFNYVGYPILHQSLVSLFPETAKEPWHTVMVRAQSQGASFSLVAGEHTIVEPWPRPKLSGAYTQFRYSFDTDAVMAAVPTVLVREIHQQPFYSFRNPQAGSVKAFCKDCSSEFLTSMAALNVAIEVVTTLDYDQMKAANTDYVAWFDGIDETVSDKTLGQLQLGLEFPGVQVVSPRLVDDFTPDSFHRPAFLFEGGITEGMSSYAWMSRTRDLGPTIPSSGYTNNQAILGKIP